MHGQPHIRFRKSCKWSDCDIVIMSNSTRGLPLPLT